MVCDDLVRAGQYLRHSLTSLFSPSQLPFSVPGRQSRKVHSMVASIETIRPPQPLPRMHRTYLAFIRDDRKRSNKTQNKQILHINIFSPNLKGIFGKSVPDPKISCPNRIRIRKSKRQIWIDFCVKRNSHKKVVGLLSVLMQSNLDNFYQKFATIVWFVSSNSNWAEKFLFNSLHCEKRLAIFPAPSRDVTNQTLPGRQ
jgi:hypothetical protein